MNSTTNDDLLSRKKESSTAERDALREALTRDQTQHPQQQRDRQQDQQDRHEMKSPASDATKKKNKKKKKKKKAGTVVDFCDTIGRRTFRVSQSDSAGRCILAARDLGAGELIIDEPPFAKVTSVCMDGMMKPATAVIALRAHRTNIPHRYSTAAPRVVSCSRTVDTPRLYNDFSRISCRLIPRVASLSVKHSFQLFLVVRIIHNQMVLPEGRPSAWAG